VARISREKYNVPLNAVAHRTYSAMFSYIRRPTLKKPLAKLDAEPYFSDLHPKEEKLERLLEASARSDAIRTCKKDLSKKRERAPDLYNLVHEKRFRTALDLQAHAAKEALDGRFALAEWCTRKGEDLEDLVDNAWAVMDAPQRAVEAKRTRLDKLKVAAAELPCICGGAWRPGAEQILVGNGISVDVFGKAVCRALHYGAMRGVNVACVGEGRKFARTNARTHTRTETRTHTSTCRHRHAQTAGMQTHVCPLQPRA
jgi:hypothetical protein